MTKKLWIFGDSYAARDNSIESSYSWPVQLENSFEVKNLAKIGTSSSWSLQKMLFEMNKIDDTSDVSLLFFLTEPYRQNWNFWKEESHHWLSGYIGSSRYSITDASGLVKQYKDRTKFIQAWFRALPGDFGDMEYYKNVSVINLWATKFEKVLVWPCFQQIKLNGTLNNNVTLSDVSMKMFEPDVNPTRFDLRPNHLSAENHKRMATILKQWINENEFNLNV